MNHDDLPPLPLPDQQGAMVTCLYCTRVRPGIGRACPRCQGRSGGFREAQMLAPEITRARILRMWAGLGEGLRALEEAEDRADADPYGEAGSGGAGEVAAQLRGRLLMLLGEIELYGFDPVAALADQLVQLEDRYQLFPEADGDEDS